MVVGALKKLIFWLGAAKSFNYHPFFSIPELK
jgi:hypothetical protein